MTKQNSPDHSFGKFESFGDFINSFRLAQQSARSESLSTLSPLEARTRLSDRDVVEVNAKVTVKEPDDLDSNGGKHQRFIVHITKILRSDPDVATDLSTTLAKQLDVFVAVRFGDSMGLSSQIPGLKVGLELKMKGEWITKEKARAHGGKKMSVLHFTHHPLGFVCTPTKCFS